MRTLHQLLGPTTDSFALVSQVVLRLLIAGILGGVVGLERELKHKPAGLRTQMFICMGSAFFTVLSEQLASTYGGDHTRIAAQIIPGIGFIGAGSILHSRGSVTGLTTAATLFVVASIGMAMGGGLYLSAIFATLLLLLSLWLLGAMETRFNLKSLLMVYDVKAANTDDALAEVNRILSDQQQTMRGVQTSRLGDTARVQFTVDVPRKGHEALLGELRQSHVFHAVQSLPAEPE